MSKKNYTLENVDGNAFAILTYVCTAMRREGKSNEEIEKYLLNVQSGDYHHLVEVSVEMCERLNGEDGNTHLILVDWDGENLPTRVEIPTDIDDEDVDNYLYLIYGGCVNFWYEI